MGKNKNKNIKPIRSCRLCGGKHLLDILSLGEQGLSDFIDISDKSSVSKYPLELILCTGCSLLQLKHTTPPQKLYTERYGYRSGINQTMRDELSSITKQAESLISLKKGDIVLDIGCNDGTLLAEYKTPDIIRVGFDPVPSFVIHFEKALNPFGVKNYKLFNDFFSKEPFLKEFKGKKAKIITAISMFYDLDDPNTFVSDIKSCLDKNGLLVIQQNYLVGMLKQNAFDNIVHEHLEYYSLTSLENLLKKYHLEIFDVSESSINGGSFRTFIKHEGSRLGTEAGRIRVEQMRKKERSLNLTSPATYHDFAKRVKDITKKLYDFIKKEARKGKVVYIYGASTRGNTLLQACKLNSTLIKAAAERNSDKWGKKIASLGIPIISEEEARSNRPDFFLVLPWFFREEFLKREKAFLKRGGGMIFPLPKFEVVKLS